MLTSFPGERSKSTEKLPPARSVVPKPHIGLPNKNLKSGGPRPDPSSTLRTSPSPHLHFKKQNTPPKTTSAKPKSSPCIPFGTQGELLFQLRSDESNFAVLPRCGLIICTARPDGSDARNEPRRPPGSWRTAPWHAPGRRGSGGCNGSRWPGTPDTCPCCQPWR